MVRCTNTIVHISRLGVAACVVAEASVCDGRRWEERLESFACELASFHQRIASLLD